MSDMNSLNGASVRDAAGRTGRVLSVTDATIRVAWMQKGLIAEEVALERTALAKDLQVLTLKESWQPLVGLMGVTPPKVLSKTAQLAEELQVLFEAKKKAVVPSDKKLKKKAVKFGRKTHSPFKRFHSLGPGPDNTFGTREVSKKTAWDCTKSGSYKQKCTLLKKDAKGRLRKTDKVKNITIKKPYKQSYNHAYKAWRKAS
jgi:hypothetical protein